MLILTALGSSKAAGATHMRPDPSILPPPTGSAYHKRQTHVDSLKLILMFMNMSVKECEQFQLPNSFALAVACILYIA